MFTRGTKIPKLNANFSSLGPKYANKLLNIFLFTSINVLTTRKFGFHHPEIKKKKKQIRHGI